MKTPAFTDRSFGDDALVETEGYVAELPIHRIEAASPSEHRYYVLVLFDITDTKKYGKLVKLIKRYCTRIQKSVFEAYLRQKQIAEFENQINRIMRSDRYYNPSDRVRLYKLSGKPSVTIFGEYDPIGIEENIFV